MFLIIKSTVNFDKHGGKVNGQYHTLYKEIQHRPSHRDHEGIIAQSPSAHCDVRARVF